MFAAGDLLRSALESRSAITVIAVLTARLGGQARELGTDWQHQLLTELRQLGSDAATRSLGAGRSLTFTTVATTDTPRPNLR